MYFKCCKIAMYYIVKLLLTVQLSLLIMWKKMRGLTLLAEIHYCEPGKIREGAARHRLLQRGLGLVSQNKG